MSSASTFCTICRSISKPPEPTRRANRKRGRRRQAGLHHLRLGDAEFVVGGLQATIVEQGDLHGAGCGQRLGEQLFDARRDVRLFVGAIDLGHVLAELGGGGGLNDAHAGIR